MQILVTVTPQITVACFIQVRLKEIKTLTVNGMGGMRIEVFLSYYLSSQALTQQIFSDESIRMCEEFVYFK